MSFAKIIGLAAPCVVFAATSAEAHIAAEGLGDFSAGLLHPLLTLPHALALIAFGLICGQHGASPLRFGLPGLALGLGCGFAAAYLGGAPTFASPFLTALALLCGLGVAAFYQPPMWAALVIGVLAGGAVGLESKPDAATLLAQVQSIAGTTTGVLLLYLNLAGLAAFAAKSWQQIGVRVIGSWTSAASFLNLALLLRK